jgi:uncharacterized protein (DUF58 family)
MRRFFVAAILLVALVAASSGVARSRPTITVTRVVPLIVKGSGFVAGERVKVAVREPAVYRKTVTAGRLGGFTATFRVALGKCVRIRVVATGNKGSRASDTVPPSCTV